MQFVRWEFTMNIEQVEKEFFMYILSQCVLLFFAVLVSLQSHLILNHKHKETVVSE